MAGIALLLTLGGCELQTAPLPSVGVDAGKDRDASDAADAEADAQVACTDADEDGTCSDVDCDDTDRDRAPSYDEFCPDHLDNDCDDLVDFADECDRLNDECMGPIAVLRQPENRNPARWEFDIPLAERYRHDYLVGLGSAGNGCLPKSGRNGADAVFQIIAAAPSDVEIAALGEPGSDLVVYLRARCGGSSVEDDCSEGTGAEATLTSTITPAVPLHLILDQNAGDGNVHLRVELTRQ